MIYQGRGKCYLARLITLSETMSFPDITKTDFPLV